MKSNQKGSATIILLVVLVVVLVMVLVYFAFLKKPGEVVISPTPTATITPKDETANWKTYTNTQYGFSFKYPGNVFAYDVVDYTNGQIPDIAGFGYTKPGQYELGTVPAEKMGSARILVWTNVSQDLKSWVKIHEPNIKNWTDTKVGGVAALVNYSKATTASEGSPMTSKAYYLKIGNEIIEIMGFSVTNQYSDSWVVNFDKIVATFKKSPSIAQQTPTPTPPPKDETANWKTYTYKNLSFKYPEGWTVVFDSEISGQPNGFSLHITRTGDGGFQPDELILSTHNDRSGMPSDYILSTNRIFSLNQSGDGYIKFVTNGTTIFAGCGYYSKGKATLDVCNKIISTIEIK